MTEYANSIISLDTVGLSLGLAPHDWGNKVRVLSESWFYGE